jgi:hypothetical protein
MQFAYISLFAIVASSSITFDVRIDVEYGIDLELTIPVRVTRESIGRRSLYADRAVINFSDQPDTFHGMIGQDTFAVATVGSVRMRSVLSRPPISDEPPRDDFARVRMSLGHNSTFAQTIGQFMLIPGSLVLQPSDPALYCQDSQISFTTPNMAQEDPFKIFVAFELGSSGTVGSSHCVFHPDRSRISVPQAVFDTLYRRIGAATGHGLVMTFPCNDAVLNQLPTLRFHISGGPSTDIAAIVELLPEDYIYVNRVSGICSLDLEASANVCELGTNFMKHVALFFDADNRRVGFGEPLHS